MKPHCLVTDQRGITYLMAMLAIVLIGVSLTMVGQQWSVIVKRDREAELWFCGNRVKEAIERFVADYEVQKATRPNRYPFDLKELTKRTPKRYLQVVYKAPMTDQDFELIKNKEGQIQGVRSSSKYTPFNAVQFKGAATYHAVRFEAVGGPAPAAAGGCAVNPLLPGCSTPGTPSS